MPPKRKLAGKKAVIPKVTLPELNAVEEVNNINVNDLSNVTIRKRFGKGEKTR